MSIFDFDKKNFPSTFPKNRFLALCCHLYFNKNVLLA